MRPEARELRGLLWKAIERANSFRLEENEYFALAPMVYQLGELMKPEEPHGTT